MVNNMKIDNAILDFINYCIFEKGHTDRTKESYLNDLEVYKEFLEKKHITNIEDIKDTLMTDNLFILVKRLISTTRLVLPKTNISATTAMEVLN